ncbi:hypothetical protein EI74_0366 [Mycoplasma testudineum]|uniref:Uncharacterized protein n=1 Tax=Mycoplasma testudineum TaxID=244584 RepID=A0A4R6IE36_9MOLU|nr:hypothetical protein [Mycoplasma testudineum]OYD26984.1 hypothetical protein CG473_01455 [Mycoplasma testudineum]TDO20530.1 hypothetical protein EI74_0366 [Mycoplasma testudineum]
MSKKSQKSEAIQETNTFEINNISSTDEFARFDRTAEQVFKDEPKLEGDDELAQLEKESVVIKTKSNSSYKSVEDRKSYEEIINQTTEIHASQKYAEAEMERIATDSMARQEKLKDLEEKLIDYNRKPLSGLDSYDSYALVLNKAEWNFNELKERNTAFSVVDMALQTHLYLYDGEIISIEKIESVIREFIQSVALRMASGNAVLLNPILIMDTVRFDNTSVLPIIVANPKLMSPMNIIEWTSVVKDSSKDKMKIIDVYLKMLENALSNGHEVEFFENSLIVRNIEGIHSLFMHTSAAQWFRGLISRDYINNISKDKIEQ